MLVILTRWLVITVAILLASLFLSGIRVDSLTTAIIAAGLLGVINVFLRPIIIILTLPLTILTLGVFAFFINAFLLLLVAHFVPGFEVNGFFSAFMGSLIISVVSWLANRFINTANIERPKPPRKPDTIDLERGDDGKWH